MALLGVLLGASFAAEAQTIEGLRVGDATFATRRFGRPAASDIIKGYNVNKWSLPDGDDLSVTATASGTIVYIEKDWTAPAGGRQSGLRDFTFAATTLAQIRTNLGSNGFSFKAHFMAPLPEGLVMFNCYNGVAKAAIATCFVTQVQRSDFAAVQAQPERIAQAARLVAVICADIGYLKTIWGGEMLFDPNNKAVAW